MKRRDGETASRRVGSKWFWAFGSGLVVLWATACTEIAGPLRTGFYGYSLIVSDSAVADTTIDGVEYFADTVYTDTVDFAWPASALPVKIWVQDTVGLPGHMQAAVAAWENVLEYGEFTATFVGDSGVADIIVRANRIAPAPASGMGHRIEASSLVPGACEGGTDVYVSAPDHTKLWTPTRMYVTPKFPLADTATVACLARVSIHELGHALGLFKHSTDPNDIMYGFPAVEAPSEGDVTTILTLYHQRSDLAPARASDTLSTAPGAP